MQYRIQILDTDIRTLSDAAQKLRRMLNQAGLKAVVEEISCFLEISRQGYMKKLPVVILDGQCMCSRYPLSEKLLEDFCRILKTHSQALN